MIDTVLLDMDGTLLDLHFDNWFWQELIPRRYALAQGVSAPDAWALIHGKFLAARGTRRGTASITGRGNWGSTLPHSSAPRF